MGRNPLDYHTTSSYFCCTTVIVSRWMNERRTDEKLSRAPLTNRVNGTGHKIIAQWREYTTDVNITTVQSDVLFSWATPVARCALVTDRSRVTTMGNKCRTAKQPSKGNGHRPHWMDSIDAVITLRSIVAKNTGCCNNCNYFWSFRFRLLRTGLHFSHHGLGQS